MESFLHLFGTMIAFAYHCFDRIVIRGYLSMVSRLEHIVFFFGTFLAFPASRRRCSPDAPSTIRTESDLLISTLV